MHGLLASIDGEFRRHKALADGALAQVPDERLGAPGAGGNNSLAVVGWHVGGNLRSRFTDFLSSDGEKPWRQRDEEFAPRQPTRQEFNEHWERGWATLFDALSQLTDEDLERRVRIRGRELAVHAALHRALAHTSYHVGQIVQLARAWVGDNWRFLSIPPGGSVAYNRDPQRETPPPSA